MQQSSRGKREGTWKRGLLAGYDFNLYFDHFHLAHNLGSGEGHSRADDTVQVIGSVSTASRRPAARGVRAFRAGLKSAFATRSVEDAMNGMGWPGALTRLALLMICLPCAVLAQRPTIPNPNDVGPTGTISVSLRDQNGRPIALPSSFVTIVRAGEGAPTTPSQSLQGGEEWVFTNLLPGVEYVVKVEAPGFASAQQFVDLPSGNYASIRVYFYLVPADRGNRLAKPAGGAILAPRAQKEVQKGIKDLRANKIHSAQKHLANALKMAPGNPLVNYLMGECWLRAGKVEKAVPLLENAISLDPKQTQALLALGRVRFQQGNMARAIELLKQAVESKPKLWQAHWLLAAAFLRNGDNKQASKQAEAALKYGKEQADSARLILGVALAKLNKREKALKTLSEYLKRHPNDRRAKEIRGLMAKLRQPPNPAPAHAAGEQPEASAQADGAKIAASAPRSGAPKPTAEPTATPVTAPEPTPPPLMKVPAKENWAPPDIDAEKPATISDATCHLSPILRHAARHAEELVTDLQKFSATEHFEEVEIGRRGGLHRPVSLEFSYLVFIKHIRPHLISVDEMRTPNPAAQGEAGPLVSTGVAALELALHPDFSGDFDWKCEGMGEWEGQPAWLIHFRQRSDRPTSRLHAFLSSSGQEYDLPLKGRVWVGANGNQVLHMETDLVKPVKQVELKREHYAINYGLVKFRSHPVALWLPKSVDAYFRFQGHSYHQYSRFSNFELFWVGTAQKIGKPKQNPPKH